MPSSKNILLQAHQERTILRLIESRRATSQLEISNALKLRPNTVNGFIRRLLEKGSIQLERSEIRGRGRPHQHYSIRYPEGIMAIQWLGSEAYAGLFDGAQIRGSLYKHHQLDQESRAVALRSLRKLWKETLKHAGAQASEVKGVIFYHGGKERSTGQHSINSVSPWLNSMEAGDFEQVFGVPTKVVTDNVAPMAELNARASEGCDNLVVLNVGDGVGAYGLVFHQAWGAPYRYNGEIGHVVADPAGVVCNCGNRGCMETLISGPALRRRLRDDLAKGVQTGLSSTLGGQHSAYFDLLEQLDREGNDPYARTIATEFLDRVAWMVGVLMNLYEPDRVVLTGYGLQGREEWKNRIAALARNYSISREAELCLEFPRCSRIDYLQALIASF